MELNPQQIAAAKARGCTFLPATEEQVARLTMQRRIFTIDGQPHVAIRQDEAVKETHGAIAMLIEGDTPQFEETTQQAAAAEAEVTLEMAGESAAARGGAQVVRRASRPRAPWRGAKRGA
ncbi:hypothetical protein [Belnapia rosea]|uniref:Uncharacterized protein n=1 Tax=Belnapia rosea TaxID=938405 RepID=A0A1G6KTQ2_9PROT|nr:hypothetical protein [Belnapia rosea]SDB23226.1 hypothetical protein SAMN02927895_00935 [Belnapia rosea]SDC34188.1 hypothetical protein SAMN04487779_1001635 [Belnapia rosea]